jgi:hypothetical protein
LAVRLAADCPAKHNGSHAHHKKTEQEVKVMPLLTLFRIPLMIVLFPVRLALSLFTGAMNFILGSVIINRVLSLVSGLLFLGFLALTWSAIFINHDMPLTARILTPGLALLASYITNPMSGALKYLRLLLERIDSFNNLLKIN